LPSVTKGKISTKKESFVGDRRTWGKKRGARLWERIGVWRRQKARTVKHTTSQKRGKSGPEVSDSSKTRKARKALGKERFQRTSGKGTAFDTEEIILYVLKQGSHSRDCFK